ncbi:MAG: peroxiredoxin [Ignavibacteria bacterium]|nr:peroxiredoxin [Ignavibacteria bacterium]
MSVLVGKKAPRFSAKAVVDGGDIVNNFSLDQFIGRKHVILFFYPKDFTFVCPTELHAFQERLPEFESKNVAIVACSTDTEESHWGWLQVPKKAGGIQGVTYPIIADTNKTIASNFDVLDGHYEYDDEGGLTAVGELVALRGLFLIDKEGIVQHQLVNSLSLGRSVDEAMRIVDALKFHEEHGEVCPANWHLGAQGLSESHTAVATYLASN